MVFLKSRSDFVVWTLPLTSSVRGSGEPQNRDVSGRVETLPVAVTGLRLFLTAMRSERAHSVSGLARWRTVLMFVNSRMPTALSSRP